MKTFNKIALALAVAGFSWGASAQVIADNEAWQAKFPTQYESWKSTSETSEVVDLIADDPNLAILWAGYGFAKDYNKARGHYYAVTDALQTLRTGAPMANTDGPMAASCWSCKSPDVARLIAEKGEAAYASKKFAAWGHEIQNSIGCADCHASNSGENILSRPYAERAMEQVGMKFSEQDSDVQAAQTCGQCHVEYHFDAKNSNTVAFPWSEGFTAENAESHYDKLGFSDWTHGISKAPMLKAQHPEFETWATSVHAEMGVTCVTCHMPKKTNAKGQEYSEHNVGNPMAAFEDTCANCHESKADMEALISANKAEINKQKLAAEALIVRAHFEAKAAWDAGAKADEMAKSLDLIRKAQWRWDFAIASHGVHVHNPSEALRLLADAQDLGKQAQTELAKVLTQYKVKQPVQLPDISTKAAAQKAAGVNLEKLKAEKENFLKVRADGEWKTERY